MNPLPNKLETRIASGNGLISWLAPLWTTLVLISFFVIRILGSGKVQGLVHILRAKFFK